MTKLENDMSDTIDRLERAAYTFGTQLPEEDQNHEYSNALKFLRASIDDLKRTPPKADVDIAKLKDMVVEELRGNIEDIKKIGDVTGAMTENTLRCAVGFLASKGLLSGVPDGYVVAREEATIEMCAAAISRRKVKQNTYDMYADIYKAMIAAGRK